MPMYAREEAVCYAKRNCAKYFNALQKSEVECFKVLISNSLTNTTCFYFDHIFRQFLLITGYGQKTGLT